MLLFAKWLLTTLLKILKIEYHHWITTDSYLLMNLLRFPLKYYFVVGQVVIAATRSSLSQYVFFLFVYLSYVLLNHAGTSGRIIVPFSICEMACMLLCAGLKGLSREEYFLSASTGGADNLWERMVSKDAEDQELNREEESKESRVKQQPETIFSQKLYEPP